MRVFGGGTLLRWLAMLAVALLALASQTGSARAEVICPGFVQGAASRFIFPPSTGLAVLNQCIAERSFASVSFISETAVQVRGLARDTFEPGVPSYYPFAPQLRINNQIFVSSWNGNSPGGPTCVSTTPQGGASVPACHSYNTCREGYVCDWEDILNTNDPSKFAVLRFKSINDTAFDIRVSGGVFETPPAQPLTFEIEHFTQEIAPGEPARLTYRLSNPNTDLRLAASQVAFLHDISFDAPYNSVFPLGGGLPADGFCGANSKVRVSNGANGASMLSFSDIALAPGSSCAFNLHYTVAPMLPRTLRQLTGQVTATFPGQPNLITPGVSDTIEIVAATDINPPVISVANQSMAVKDGVPQSSLTATVTDNRAMEDTLKFYLGSTEIPPNYVFPEGSGDYVVEARATDFAGNTGSATFNVRVVHVVTPGFSASVTPVPAFVGQTATLTYEINLPTDAAALEGLSFAHDVAYAGAALSLQQGDMPAAPCGAGSALTVTGTSFVQFSGGTLTGGETCRFSIPLQVGAPMSVQLLSSPLTATNAETGLTTVTAAINLPFTAQERSTVPPTLVLPADITTTTDAGQPTARVNFTATASDIEDGDLSGAVVLSHASGSDFAIGTTTVTASVTDTAGNSAQGSFTVTVTDGEAPVITAPADVALSIDAGQVTAALDVTGLGSVSDNSGVTPAITYRVGGTILTGAHDFPLGATNVDMSAQDAADNMAQARFQVTVSDAEKPIISASNISQPLDAGSSTASVTMAATASDNSGSATITYALTGGEAIGNPHAFAPGTHSVTATATDPGGNAASAVFEVTVYPDLPLDLSTQVIGGPLLPGAPVTYQVTLTNPNGFSISGAAFGVGLGSSTGTPLAPAGMALSYTGVTGGCTGTLGAAPAGGGLGLLGVDIAIPALGSCTISGQVSVDATTPQGAVPVFGQTFFDNAGGTFDKTVDGLTPIVVGAIVDSQAPVLTLPSDIAVVTDAGAATAAVSFTVSALDGVDGDLSGAVVLSHVSGSAFPIGTTTVTASVTDTAGNTAQGSFRVTVTDTEPPVLTAPADIVVANDVGKVTAPVTVTSLGAVSDNSGVTPAIRYSIDGVALTGPYDFPLGVTTVTMDATDSSGNAAPQQSFTVTVGDDIAPVITPPADITTVTDPLRTTAHLDVTGLGAVSDNTGIAPAIRYAIGGVALTGAYDFPVGVTTVTMDAVDTGGNHAAQARFDVTVALRAGPTIALSSDVSQLAAGEPATITFALSAAATDFDQTDISVAGGTLSGFTGSGASYSVVFTADGTVSPAVISVGDDAFTDAVGTPNRDEADADNTLSLTVTMDRSTALISDLSGPQGGVYSARITLSHPSSDFTAEDLALVNASAVLTGSGASYEVTLTPLEQGLVSVAVKAASFTGATGQSNATASNTASAVFDSQGSDVVITGLPRSFSGTGAFSATIRFSEAVSGFELTDIALGNATAGGFSGAGAAYSVVIYPTGRGDATVQIPAGAALDAAGNGNRASPVVILKNTTVAETQKKIARFISGRTNQLVANQPDLTCHLTGGCGGGGFNAQVTRNMMSFDMTSPRESSVWFSLSGSRSQSGGTTSDYVFGALGTHLKIHDHLLVGMMVVLDHVASRDASGRINGRGWMAGPYVVSKHPRHPLYFEGRVLAGTSENTISPFNTYRDNFDTRRILAQVKVSGELQLGKLTVTPSLSGSYASDRQSAYNDSLGNLIGAQSFEMYQTELGVNLTRTTLIMGHPWVLQGGLSGLVSGTATHGGPAGTTPDFIGGRGKVRLSAATELGRGARINLSTSYDGIGTPNYESIGLEFSFLWDF